MLDYMEDVESDLSAFHRVDDPDRLDGYRFLQLAERLFHYRGVMRDHAIRIAGEDGGTVAKPAPRQIPDDVAIDELVAQGFVEYEKEEAVA